MLLLVLLLLFDFNNVGFIKWILMSDSLHLEGRIWKINRVLYAWIEHSLFFVCLFVIRWGFLFVCLFQVAARHSEYDRHSQCAEYRERNHLHSSIQISYIMIYHILLFAMGRCYEMVCLGVFISNAFDTLTVRAVMITSPHLWIYSD